MQFTKCKISLMKFRTLRCETGKHNFFPQFQKKENPIFYCSTSFEHVKNKFLDNLLWSFLSLVIFTCVALAKAGLVVGPLRPSVRPVVRPSVRNALGCQVCVICNSKSFHSFLFKLCLMIVHILKMCTSYFVHVS